MSPKKKETTEPVPNDDYLNTHYFDIAELRLFLADLTRVGYKKLSIYNLLIYIKGIATTLEDE